MRLMDQPKENEGSDVESGSEPDDDTELFTDQSQASKIGKSWSGHSHNENPGHNVFRHFDVLPIFFFFSPQVKRSVIISKKHGIYELPHELPLELPKDLRRRILGN